MLNTQHYKVQVKCKWNIPKKRVAPSPTPKCLAIEKEAFRLTSTTVSQLNYMYLPNHSTMSSLQYKVNFIANYSWLKFRVILLLHQLEYHG